MKLRRTIFTRICDRRTCANNFDTSDYPSNHMCFSVNNKKVLGKFKDESNGIPILEFIGLRPKLYTFKFGDEVVKKCKGISRSVVDKEISFNNFKESLFNNSLDLSSSYRTAYTISSFKHVPFTVKQTKLALSSCDNKRFILPDKVHTLAR